MRRKQWILSVLADVLFALGLAAVAIGIAMSGSIPLAGVRGRGGDSGVRCPVPGRADESRGR